MFKSVISKYFTDQEHYFSFGKEYRDVSRFKRDINTGFLPEINRIFKKYNIIFNDKFSKMNSHMTFSCTCKDNNSIIITIYLDDENQPKYIYIDYLVSCKVENDEIKGGDILTNIIQLKEDIGAEYIKLMDVSFKVVNKCRLNLAIFKIITSVDGFSWYNKYGFFSKNHADNIRNNLQNRTITFSTLIENIKPVHHQVKIYYFTEKYTIHRGTTIRSYFLSVQHSLIHFTSTINSEFIYDLNDLLELLVNSGIIQYDNVLYYKSGTYLTSTDIDDIDLSFL